MSIESKTVFHAKCDYPLGCETRTSSYEKGNHALYDTEEELTSAFKRPYEDGLEDWGWLVVEPSEMDVATAVASGKAPPAAEHYCEDHTMWDEELGERVPMSDPNPWFCTLCGRMSAPHHIGELHAIALFHAQATTVLKTRTPREVALDAEERTEMVMDAHQQLQNRRRR